MPTVFFLRGRVRVVREAERESLTFKFRPRIPLDALTAPSQVYDYYNPEAHTVVAPARFVVR